MEHDKNSKPLPDVKYRQGSLHNYKDKEWTSSHQNDIYYVKFIVEQEKGKFYYVYIGCPFASDKPCIKNDDKLANIDKSPFWLGNQNVWKEVEFYTDEKKEKIKENYEKLEKLDKMFK